MYYRYRLSLLFACTFLALLNACSSQIPTVSKDSRASTSTQTGTNTAIPPTNTTCPQVGTTRIAVLSPMTAGSNPALVTIDDQKQVYLYDVKNGKYTIIMQLPQKNDVPQLSLDGQLAVPQLSADRQWLLFLLASPSGQQELRIVRLDGKGMQTLYCSPGSTSLSDLRWSPDQKRVAFSEYTSNQKGVATAAIKLLDLTSGTLTLAVQPRTEKKSTENGTFEEIYAPRPAKWVDNTHLYVQSQLLGTEAPRSDLYLLDITKELPLQLAKLPKLATGVDPFFDFANSGDGSKLYVSHCSGELGLPIVPKGPSSITVQPSLGSPASILLQTLMAVTAISVVAPTTILFVVNRGIYPTEHNQEVLAHNGLWKMNEDGSGLTRLMQTGAYHTVDVVPDSAPKSNLYAVSNYDGKQQTLGFGYATESRITTIAQFSIDSERKGGQAIIGWTTR